MLSRIRAWLWGDGEDRNGGVDGTRSDGDGDAADAADGGDGTPDDGLPEVDRTRPLVPLRREEFVAGGGFVVLDGDRPGSGVPGEDLNRLHGAATDRFDLDAVEENHKVADVALAADGTVLDVKWYDDPVPVASRFRG
jgi:hypothetical protein